MATQPDPDSPFLASRLESALGVSAPGTPGVAGNPTPQAAGVNFPAPPTPAMGIPGRPPNATASPKSRQSGVPGPNVPPSIVPTAPVPPNMAPATTTPQAQVVPGTPATNAGGVSAVPQAGGAPISDPNAADTDAQYRAAVLKGRTDLGPIPRLFRHPSLPDMPFTPGQHNFNPFTGAWVAPDGGQQQ